jgi:ADP-dependent NAD(P)H-hydrate dehydratase / NAD(P)H-hydrate epimerase
MSIVTPEEMRAIDAAAPEPVEELVGRAGRAVGRSAVDMLGGSYGRTVAVIAGAGNNGADGRVAGEWLRRRGMAVKVFDAAECPVRLPPSDLVIDAAYGTGYRASCRAPWTPPDTGGGPVLAVDIPSGLDASTGEHAGAVLTAARTVTFQALKPGLLFGDGPSLAGDIEVVDIGLDVSRSTSHRVDAGDVSAWFPRRSADAHKWSAAVRIVAGSPGMLGAAGLAARGAARCGAGLVAVSSPGGTAPAPLEVLQPSLPDTEWADEVLDGLGRYRALVVGPGLGRDAATVASIRRLIARAAVPVVADGDALHALAAGDRLDLARRPAPTVLTPHDGEFEQLTGAAPGRDRLDAARGLAIQLGCTVLLKGPATVVADETGAVLVVDHGDERLATAGSGDVLAGMIGALLASGLPPLRAAATAAWLHADAARRGPNVGFMAGDLPDLLPAAITGLGERDGR